MYEFEFWYDEDWYVTVKGVTEETWKDGNQEHIDLGIEEFFLQDTY